jgi:phospholipase C
MANLDQIDHFVFLMLENRSFDHMLGYLSRSDTPSPIAVDGLSTDPVWLESKANYEADGKPPSRIEKLGASQLIDDPPHGWENVDLQINTPGDLPGPNPMGGFVKTYVDAWEAEEHRRPADPAAVMGYYDHNAVWAFDFLARNYRVCDRWFTPLPTGTQPNRLMAMGGHTTIRRNKKPIIPDHDLVYDWLKRHDKKWRTYISGGGLPFFALMPRWWDEVLESVLFKGKFRNFRKLREHWLSDDELPPVIFIEPAYSELKGDRANDDHAPTRIKGGQVLVADLYDILTSHERRWAKTLLIITYDEHGGFFDHAKPLRITKQVGNHLFKETGPRVPALLVSPLVDAGVKFSEEVDHTAVLALLAEKFTEDVPYSDEVKARHDLYPAFGKLSNALRSTPRPGPVPKLRRPLSVNFLSALSDGLKSMVGASPSFLAPDDAPPDAGTPTAVAFDEAVRETLRKRPDLFGDDEWEGLQSAAAKLPPEPTDGDHIGSR